MLQKAIETIKNTIGRYNQFINQYARVSQDAADAGMAYVNWGIDLAEQGLLGDAIEKFKQAHSMSPNRAEPLNNWGVALAKLGQIDEALKRFEQAHHKDPHSVKALMMWGAALLEKGETETAEAKYRQALKIAPHNPEPYTNWGVGLARMGRYHEAIKNFQQALAIYPYQGDAYFYWGASLAELGRYEEAIQKFHSTIRFIPNHGEAFYFWAISLNRLKRYDEAILISQKAAELSPLNPDVFLNLGDAHGNKGQLQEAITAYRHVINLNPNIAEAYLSLGIALSKNNAVDEALACFKRAQMINPDLHVINHHWGALLAQHQQFDEAFTLLELFDQHYPEHVDNLIQLGLCLCNTNRRTEGLSKLKAACQLAPDNPQTTYLLGTQYLLSGQPEQAIKALSVCLEHAPQFIDAAINLAMAYAHKNDLSEAIRTLRPMVREFTDNAPVQFYYGNLLLQQGDLGDARSRFEKALEINPKYTDAILGLAEVSLAQRDWQQSAIQLAKLDKNDLPDLVWQHLRLRVAFANALHATEDGEKQHWAETAKAQLQDYQSANPPALDLALFNALTLCLDNNKALFQQRINDLKTQHPDSTDLITQFTQLAE